MGLRFESLAGADRPAGFRRIPGAGLGRGTVRRRFGLRPSIGRSLDHLARVSPSASRPPGSGEPTAGQGVCARGWPSRPRRAFCPIMRGRSRPIAWRRVLPSAGPAGLVSNFSAAGYIAMVERAIDYIRAGDVFQVNLSQRLLFPARESAVALYLRLRRCNPAPFAGYFDLGEFQIASASPERFLKVVGRRGRNAADQRNPAADAPARGRSVCRRRSGAKRKRSGRERDDRRSDAERSGQSLPGR